MFYARRGVVFWLLAAAAWLHCVHLCYRGGSSSWKAPLLHTDTRLVSFPFTLTHSVIVEVDFIAVVPYLLYFNLTAEVAKNV